MILADLSELTELGCNIAHLSEPLPPHDFLEWLAKRGEGAAVTEVA